MSAGTGDHCDLFATTNVGLEFVVASELAEKLPGCVVAPVSVSPDGKASPDAGKVFFAMGPGQPVSQAVERLRSPEQIYALVGCLKAGLSLEKEVGLAQLHALASNAPQDAWDAAVRSWRAMALDGESRATRQPTFCVRAVRRERSQKHGYNRHEIEVTVGDAIYERFGWPVKLKGPDMAVYADIYDDTAVVGVALLPEASHLERRRQEKDAGVGSTPMRRSTAYAMIRLLDLHPGDICVDCMCGSGSLLLEGAASFARAVYIGSDVCAVDIGKAGANATVQGQHHRVDLGVFDACRLPFRKASVDAMVVDLPFGRRHGSHRQNQSLYPRALRECARVMRAGGRAVMLTMDKAVMKHACGNNKQ